MRLILKIAGGIILGGLVLFFLFALLYEVAGDAYRRGREQEHQICVEDSANKRVT